MCGASSQQKDTYKQQSAMFSTMMDQSKSVFGDASSVFKDLQSTFSPIVAAGPNQHGYNAATLSALNTQATQGTAQTYAKAAKAVGEQQAAQGGGNTYIPSGANTQTQADIATSAAANESAQKTGIMVNDFATGRENWLNATKGLAGATDVFNPSTAMANAATGSGKAAADTANQMAQADNSWVDATIGALGAVGGAVATGGMSNMGKGVGFFGGSA